MLVVWFVCCRGGDGGIVEPLTFRDGRYVREGFRFPEGINPDKKLAELYAEYVKGARLDMITDLDEVFVKDLYKFYLRSCVELIGKS